MKGSREVKALVAIIAIGFGLNLLSLVGNALEANSLAQLLVFRIGDTAAMMGCIAAGRYVGGKGLHAAATAFAMLGIVHGISAGASSLSSINVEATASMIIPMIPSLILLLWCSIFPLWTRIGGVLLAIPFAAIFYRVVHGSPFFHWTVYLAYGLLAALEMSWAVLLWKDSSRQRSEEEPANRPLQPTSSGGR